jgi:hypothetical protein
MIGGAVINTVIGAGIKLGANMLNAWLEQKKQAQMLLAARDQKMVDALISNQVKQASNPFVQVTRRMLFLTITFTLCFMMVYYAMNPGIQYDVIVPKGETSKLGIFSWFTGGKDFEVVRLTGGLLLMSFMDLAFMVIGFYAIPSRRR